MPFPPTPSAPTAPKPTTLPRTTLAPITQKRAIWNRLRWGRRALLQFPAPTTPAPHPPFPTPAPTTPAPTTPTPITPAPTTCATEVCFNNDGTQTTMCCVGQVGCRYVKDLEDLASKFCTSLPCKQDLTHVLTLEGEGRRLNGRPSRTNDCGEVSVIRLELCNKVCLKKEGAFVLPTYDRLNVSSSSIF